MWPFTDGDGFYGESETAEAVTAKAGEAIHWSVADLLPNKTAPEEGVDTAAIEEAISPTIGALLNDALQMVQSTWHYTFEACRAFWKQHGMDAQQVLDKLFHLLLWILHHANRLLEFLLRHAHGLFDFLVCQRCVTWLHERTGVPSDALVLVSGSCVAGVLLLLFFNVRKRLPGKRRKERNLSADINNVRGQRDRGFSMDLSVTQMSQSSATRNRGYSLDFWNRNKRPRKESDDNMFGNSSDLLTTTDVDDRFIQALQHGIGAGTTNKNNNNGTNGSSSSHAATQHRQAAAVAYYGPTETKLLYSTFTPPPSWTEASRSLLPHDTRIKLQREIALDLSKDDCIMAIREPTSHQTPLTLPVAQCSVHVKAPVIGGILEIYVKDSSKEEWMEHTFDTAKNAAQFQIDMLAIQIFGPALNRMYQSLELIHQGSIACDGREYVCHHDSMSNEVPQGVGIAWDDVMRALGSNLPSLRVALERFWWHHYSMNSLRLQARERARKQQQKGSTIGPVSTGGGNAGGGNGAAATTKGNRKEVIKKHQNEYIYLNKDYVRKRLLMGPVDFFRLFVPCLPDTALPHNESTKQRMEQLLRWRKRTATAALLVQGYVKARIVVNHGWRLHRSLPTHYLSRRLSFDDNLDNTQRDANAKNEYYEATVSRDVLTFVRPDVPNAFEPDEYWWQWRPKRLRTAISKYQAFTLVGHHVFKIPRDEDFPLNPRNDPVLTFGSLREMVEAHPDVEFFVAAVFPEMSKTAFVTVYARTLPHGIDPAFDRNMSRYRHGSKVIRDKKLSMMMQIGAVPENRTWVEVTTIKTITYLMRTMADGVDASTPNSDMGPSDRTPFPTIPVCKMGETRHFGGPLQEDRNMPHNYTSFTLHVDAATARFNVFARVLLSMIERGLLNKNVFDITYVLAANEKDELPERAMSTLRGTRIAAQDIGLPSIYVYGSHGTALNRRRSTQDANFFQSTLKLLSIKNLLGSASILSDDDNSIQIQNTTRLTMTERRANQEAVLSSFRTSVVASDDPIEMSVNELIDILEAVKVPVRRDQLPQYDFSGAVPMSLLEAFSSANDGTLHDKDLINMSLLLLITRGQIRRHFVASGCSLKKAAIRIVETAAWRGQTFPVDRRICRIELQSGQFFQQGKDKEGRPVFYFRNMGLGPWRKDTDASVAAILHRLEGALHEFSARKEDVQCTVVIIMGKPFKEFGVKLLGDGASTAGNDSDDDDLGGSQMSASFRDAKEISSDCPKAANPRVNPEESWQVHTNSKLVRQLVDLLSAHYPERLHRALVVAKPSHTTLLRKVFGSFTLSNFVDSPVTRSKVKILSRFTDLQKYVEKNELVTIAGGDQPIDPEVFGLFDPLC